MPDSSPWPVVWRVAAIAGALLALSARAQGSPEQPLRTEWARTETELKATGEFVRTMEQRFRIQTEAGVRSAQLTFHYSASLQRFEVLEAYTAKADGSRVQVGKEATFARELPMDAGASVFADLKTVSLVFPQVGVGDSIHARVRYEQVKPMLAGHFTALALLSPSLLVDERSIKLKVPAGLRLFVDNRGYRQTRVEKDGAIAYEWTARITAVEPAEEGAVTSIDYGTRLAVSTFSSYAEFAKAYDAPAREAATVTPEIRALAERITEKAADPREQARRLYDWVAGNIRYVSISLGTGAVVPHPATGVLTSRYGDCKDHVALLQALLTAKGIESTPALIRPGPSFWLPEVPVLEAFDHAITYIPSLDLFLDASSHSTPFGRLPIREQGRVALLTATGALKATPVSRAEDELQTRRVKYEIGDGGTIDAVTEIEATGHRAELYRELAKNLTAERQAAFVRKNAGDRRFQAEGKVEFTGTEEPSDAMRLKVTYTLRGGIDWPGSGSFEVPAGFRGAGGLEAQPIGGGPPWKRPHVYSPAKLVDEYEIRLPARMKIVAIPKDVHFQNEITSYDAAYRLDGRTLRVKRTMVDRFKPPLVGPELFPKMVEYSDAMKRDLRAQVVYAEE